MESKRIQSIGRLMMGALYKGSKGVCNPRFRRNQGYFGPSRGLEPKAPCGQTRSAQSVSSRRSIFLGRATAWTLHFFLQFPESLSVANFSFPRTHLTSAYLTSSTLDKTTLRRSNLMILPRYHERYSSHISMIFFFTARAIL